MKGGNSLQKLTVWYEQRPLRERIMLLVCLLAVGFFLWDTLLMSNLALQKKNLQNRSGQLQLELSELGARQQIVELRKDFDPDRDNRIRLEQLQGALQQSRQQLEESVDNLVSPQDMAQLLRELLVGQQKLRLLNLENQPAEVLQIAAAATEAGAAEQLSPVLYRHRLQLEFAGDYLATLAYLKKLENLPRKLVWENLEIETQQYPQARVRLSVYTLSLNKGWIGG